MSLKGGIEMLKEMICYRVEVRLKVISVEQEDEENYFEYEENISWSDGAIIIENEKFEGFLTNDYIYGEIKENQIILHLFDNNHKYLLFKTSEDDYFIELPNIYEMKCVLKGMEYFLCELEFKNIEKDFDKISSIRNQTERVKELHTK